MKSMKLMSQVTLAATILLGSIAVFGQAFTFRDQAYLGNNVAAAAGGGGGGGGGFSDNFNRANSDTLGAGTWTEIAGDIDILSNEASSPATFDFSEKAAIYSATACTTVNQFVKMDLPASNANGCRPGAIFRYTDSSSPFYEVRVQLSGPASAIWWVRLATPGGTETAVGTHGSFNLTPGTTVGITCSGTGNSTVINFFLSPSGNAPTTASLWGGAGPDLSMTDDPASPVDTGAYVGIGGIGAAGLMTWDNFIGGDIP